MKLPQLMIAPNGARKTKADHPNIPLRIPEVIAQSRACFEHGAGALHLHLRDGDGGHILDAGLYREAVGEIQNALPDMMIQITTEAVGIYTAAQQRNVALGAGAKFISASIREMHADTDMKTVRRFFDDCTGLGITIQHILYDVSDFDLLAKTLSKNAFHAPDLQVLYVLGRYTGTTGSTLGDLEPFLAAQRGYEITPDWAICAFGPAETDCLIDAQKQGGKMRVGFENSFWNKDGTVANSNAERVLDLLRNSATLK